MSDKLVSIVMPAYNAADCIEESVACILNQSYENIELIVVNDGSKDETGEILQSLMLKDRRLKAINTKNGGPAKARNLALKHLSPESGYTMFADSDDYLAPDAVEYALRAADFGADMVIFGYTILDAQGNERNYCEKAQLLDRQSFKDSFAKLYTANLLNQVWGKLYKSSIIRDNFIDFPDYRWGEDRFFVFDCIAKAKKLAILPECKYKYIMHEGESLITKFYDKKFFVCKEIDKRVEAICHELGISDEAPFKYMFSKSVFSCITNLYSSSCYMSEDGKRDVVREIITDPRVEARCKAAAGGFPTAFLNACLRSGSVGLNLFVFHAVALIGEKAPALFIKLKHKK